MKSSKPILMGFLFLTLMLTTPFTVFAETHYYREYDVFMEAFITLAETYPEHINYEVVGQTALGNDIIMFSIGDKQNPKVLFDGAMHGEETLGSEILYLYAKWLVTSNDTIANQTLQNVCTLMIPALNVDNYNHLRTNINHVDLNRNFVTNWGRSGSSNPESWYYRGPSAASEPETQTLISVFEKIQPQFYVNLHFPGGQYYMGSLYNNQTYSEYLIDEIIALSNEQAIETYEYRGESRGLSVGDAANLGITSFLIELYDQIIPLNEIEQTVFPKFLTIACTLSQNIKPEETTDENQTPTETYHPPPYINKITSDETNEPVPNIPEFTTTNILMVFSVASILFLFITWKLKKQNNNQRTI